MEKEEKDFVVRGEIFVVGCLAIVEFTRRRQTLMDLSVETSESVMEATRNFCRRPEATRAFPKLLRPSRSRNRTFPWRPMLLFIPIPWNINSVDLLRGRACKGAGRLLDMTSVSARLR
jgi:hypothetical protein